MFLLCTFKHKEVKAKELAHLFEEILNFSN